MEAFKVLPMSIDILPVNRALQARDEFRHWEYRYDQLKQFSSAECAAFDGQKKVEQTGIHIHWNLPREFRTDNVKVPNRYLVAVMDEEDRSVNGWVIESDSCSSGCPAETKAGLADGRGSQYQQDGCIMEIGAVYPMETWKETHSDKERADLTATAPGNALFSQYTPQNQNVFSMRYTPKKEKGTFRYLVVGWYAEQPGQPLCCGRVCHVQWDLDGTVPSQDPLEQLCDSGCLRLAIGASSTQALEALLTEQLKDINENSGAQVANIQAQLITAAYSDGITLLNQPGSEVLLAEKEHNDTFIARNSGTRFVNAVRESDEEKKNAGPEMDKANRLQAQLDESRLQYEALSKKLLSLWWKRGHFPDFPPVPGHTREDFAPFFQGDSQDSLLYKTVYQALKTQALQKEKELLRVEGLREIPAQRFFQVQNPVITAERHHPGGLCREGDPGTAQQQQIGRASCRERV